MIEHVATSHNIHYVDKYLSHAHVLPVIFSSRV